MRAFITPTTFRRLAIVTLAAVYFLILVGGVVRASGAGMGCPDWPKCFGQWIPPTNVSQLPPDYQEIYAHRGYADTEFNAVKTWTEYINRLIGASIGLLVFLTLIASFAYWTTDRPTVLLSGLSFALVAFNGWLGSVVVASNLVPFIITLHMVAALVLVCVLIFAVARTHRDSLSLSLRTTGGWGRPLLFAALVLSLVQILLGTQVREHVDEIAVNLGNENRDLWFKHFGATFYVHRTFSLLLLAVNVTLAAALWKAAGPGALRNGAVALISVILAEIAAGAGLYYLGMPAWLQPTHLLLGAVLFGLQFFLLVAYRFASMSFAVPTTSAAAPLTSQRIDG
ncbi:MAG: hypothetical protein AMXMBFR4_13870 [Candidatus Hydrogenedentota bacterium]